MNAAIETSGLSKTYGTVRALTGLDLEVPRHSIFGLLGPNGSGKSTAMKLLLGLVRPSGGHGSIFGLDIARESVEVRQRVGYLAQEPRFYEHLTARETLRFVLRFFDNIAQAEHEQRVETALELVGLKAKADRPVRGYSGGERQRLGIAQASIHEPDLLILDEPAAALDPMGRRDVLDILGRLRESATVVYSTHILDDVQRVSDRVAILKSGRLVAQAPITELLAGDGSANYAMVLHRTPESLQDDLAALPWVTEVTNSRTADAESWRVTVSNADAAEEMLLRVVLREPGVRVIDFRRSKAELEDVFLELMRGGEHAERSDLVSA